MQNLGIIVNHANPRASDALRLVEQSAARLGLVVHADASTCRRSVGSKLVALPSIRAFMGRVEAVVVLGGDGTLLQVAHDLEGVDVPLMGFNIGSLGYLTSVDEAHFEEALLALRENRFQVSERATLAARIMRAGGATEPVRLKALNDVVVSRGASARLVHIGLDLGGTPVTTYACDGVIVATATGSTAYALAAGGPILMPETQALAISVICPHALGARPLVVPVDLPLSLRCETASEPLLLALDGRECGLLEAGDRADVSRSPAVVRIAFPADRDPYAVLRRKLGWGGALEGRISHRPA
jgi:NAD+ kinase